LSTRPDLVRQPDNYLLLDNQRWQRNDIPDRQPYDDATDVQSHYTIGGAGGKCNRNSAAADAEMRQQKRHLVNDEADLRG
jgi:hypothetical protein